MKIHFYLRYSTQFGESLRIALSAPEGQTRIHDMSYLNRDYWHALIEVSNKETLRYQYIFEGKNGEIETEWETDRILDTKTFSGDLVQTIDAWNPASAYENAFYTQPFREIFLPAPAEKAKKNARFTHQLKVKAPLLQPHERLCILGHGAGLRNWDALAPILMQREGNWWTAALDLSGENFPLAYKYGVWDARENRFVQFESGENRPLYAPVASESLQTVVHDGFVRLPNTGWRGAGVAIPVFSLRSKKSFGVGEFTDIPALVDWAKSVGMKLIQLLPINDTSATGSWTDSYPYASISAFALHPIYLNIEKAAGKAEADLIKPLAKRQKQLNALDEVDYEAVLSAKWEAIRILYAAQRADFLKNPAYLSYFEENKHWLAPYAAFCCLKERFGTSDFNQWPAHSVYDAADIAKLSAPSGKHFDEIAVHYFVQWHLHLQLKAATDYAHANGLAVKGDIPIGIYRYSCDAWVAPELYNMDRQAGAPPDDFAEKGQNWGFPTYNWERMKADNFAWWRQRFQQMSLYFDAFRIDHILGFFRIWSIPLDAVEGILGVFVPAIPVSEREFHEAGIGFSRQRLCRPHITERVLWEMLGDDAAAFAERYLQPEAEGFSIKPAFASQRAVAAQFEQMPGTEANMRDCQALYDLISNVILFDGGDGAYHFRFGMDKTSSFRHLDSDVQAKIKALYINYFYRRQDAFWEKEAMEKLPALKRSTDMLICGEDLGMVPDCVPGVMKSLGILSLEIQRMPKALGATFFHPKDAPYLAVVTPSTHDMSTIRGWWEENPALSGQFYNEALGQWGEAPYFCEAWINRAIIAQHLHSPAMWSIFQLQDLMGSDAALRRENPADERINVPANPKHYWRYRMHLSLEDLQKQTNFNNDLKTMVAESGRAQ